MKLKIKLKLWVMFNFNEFIGHRERGSLLRKSIEKGQCFPKVKS